MTDSADKPSRGKADRTELRYYADGRAVPLTPADDVATTALPAEVRRRLPARPRHVVYRVGGELIVVLPEIRVEDDDPARIDAVRKLLARRSVTMESPNPQRLDIAVASSDGRETLRLACEIWETARPALAQPHFLRLLRQREVGAPKRPRIRRKGA